MSSPPQVHLLTLDDAGAPSISGSAPYINLPAPRKPYTLRLAIEGASSICREGSLWINFPESGKDFQRDTFREIKLNPSFSRTLYIDIPIDRAGTFCYYITYSPLPPFKADYSELDAPKPTRTECYYITVAPHVAINGETAPLDSLAVISILSKFLGPVTKWDPYLKYVSDKNYNMIHFTPLMKRGSSNSPFSIRDFVSFDPIAFPKGEKDVIEITSRMEKEYGILALTDIVLNHCSPDSEWLLHHPDAGYNPITAPWLLPAYELDNSLQEFSRTMGKLGYPTELRNKEDLLKAMEGVKTHAIAQADLWQFYVLDVEKGIEEGIAAWLAKKGESKRSRLESAGYRKEMSIFEKAQILVALGLEGVDRLGERYRKRFDPAVTAAYLAVEFGLPGKDDKDAISAAREGVKAVLNEVNLPFYKEYDSDMAEALEQIYNRAEYTRLADHGPKMGPITEEYPLAESYFTRLPVNDITKKHDPLSLNLANNGWLWNNTADFAGSHSKAYLRREVISWSDCVKLRFGDKPEDSPFLWDYMGKYTTLMAKCFQGFRLDNCHSTPLHVGEHFLDIARRVRPDLYTVAELFTGDEVKDRIFLERLGLNSLIREGMVAWAPGELSRLIHRHGGKPIGSFEQDFVTRSSELSQTKGKTNGLNGDREEIRAVTASPIHALFMDCTHDNETPTDKRTPQDTLPTGALSAMVDCAVGSVYGYDEVNPHLVDLVHETRNYTVPPKIIDEKSPGIAKVKQILNKIHIQMGKDGYSEMHVHHEEEYITMHRVHPKTHHGYFLVAHTAFGPGEHRGNFNPVTIPKTKAKTLGSWRLVVDGSQEAKDKVRDAPELSYLPSSLEELESPRIEEHDGTTTITIPDFFPPGSITLLETWIPGFDENLDSLATSGAEKAFESTNLADLNFFLYRCEAEERDSSDWKDGVYDVPGHGPLVYAGLQGWWSVLKDIISYNNLAHPLCQHLRDGQWALDYLSNRLQRLVSQGHSGLKGPEKWLKERFDAIRKVPSFLLPRYFGLVVQTVYTAAVEKAVQLMGSNIQHGTPFLKKLALVSIQMTGYMSSTSLWPDKQVPCMAAGLPHFAHDYMRCWGRDVFISVRGLYLATGRYDDAKEHILAFASVLKHGMIPNLLDAGRRPRYNSRDSIWFFLQSIQDYTKIVPGGISIMKEKVRRRFLPYDDTWFDENDERVYKNNSTIEEIVQEALQRHAEGMKFREANAGTSIDSQMKDEGFNLEIATDWDTGFVKGGNQWNCGTWMDKMGESEKAGNKGHPGTPRDGSAIEIIGLLYSTLKWAAELSKAGKYQWKSVKKADGNTITLEDWAGKIQSNFERCFYIPKDPEQDAKHVINKDIVNRRGIYKDLFGSGKEFEDYQLRANYAIAMTVAPEIFDPTHALGAIEIADAAIRGPTGIATLDPSDMNYRPDYINSLDNDDFACSKGRNYHQGPEWLWPTGFFLRAMLKFDSKRRKTKEEKVEMLQQVATRMEECRKELDRSPWAGLTELTNKNGSYCADSSPTQAWSAGCLIDLFFDAQHVEF